MPEAGDGVGVEEQPEPLTGPHRLAQKRVHDAHRHDARRLRVAVRIDVLTRPQFAPGGRRGDGDVDRVADFMEFGELLARDALVREESCGGHFRVEYQTSDGEAKRNDAKFCHVAAWEYAGDGKMPIRNEEPLTFETVKLVERSYK